MLKHIKHVLEHDTVADKLRRRSLHFENNKSETVNADRGSPITPLRSPPSGLTSAATTTSTSSFNSSSSESVTGRGGHAPVTTKTDSRRSNPSAAKCKPSTSSAVQSATNNPAAAQLSCTSAAQSYKPAASSAAKSLKSAVPPAAAHRRSSSTSAGVKVRSSINIPKTASGNPRACRSSLVSDSALTTVKQPGKSSTTPPQPVKIVPAGNIIPSGKVHITGMTQGVTKSMVLGPGSKSYGYGSVVRGNSYSPTTSVSSSGTLVIASSSTGGSEVDTSWQRVMNSPNPEEAKRLGNEMFKKGCFIDALKFYDRALKLSPTNAKYHSNRAAALSGLGRIGEAEPSDPMVVKVLQQVDRHLNKCAEARRRGLWNVVLTKASAAMESGADMSPQLVMCKVEALLKLQRLDEAQTILASSPNMELLPASFLKIQFFDMISQAYIYFVKSQIELALGRFENAVTFTEKASEIDPRNSEIKALYRNVRLIVRARDRGNELYESERYTEAIAAYTEGLKFDQYNATLLGHRAECFFKVGYWESSIEDCNHALLILPSYTKIRRQRAASYSKLERWDEAVSDYEALRKELSYDREIAESLFHAQVALKRSRGGVVLNMEFGCEVEEISTLEEFKAALTRPGVSVVLFMKVSDRQCKEMSVFMDALCIRYPSLHFLKVDIERCPGVGDAEKVRIVPTFKIYKLGTRMKEIVCPSKEALESSVRHYSL
ncbi:hypothetical protein F2Q69_00038328 [Brassica cretica]|uniref:Thioredoxin domain-containing protein n=1 Tax=Brassica cretica TaxID=69181 RepID=A0A8S9SGB5_BRACR|nr:hypothetical protein F2Q69_00038328 [Brassica cretica]